MARNRERVRLEDGLKLDSNLLRKQGIAGSGSTQWTFIDWGPRSRTPGDASSICLVVWRFLGPSRGSIRLLVGMVDQSIDLVAASRHFGGVQWYFVCPILRRRASVLWMPVGASRFASRKAWGPEFAYGSQFKTAPYRALSPAFDIRHRLGGHEYSGFDAHPPSKPKGMHRYTYEAQLKRLESYERTRNLYVERLIARSNKV